MGAVHLSGTSKRTGKTVCAYLRTILWQGRGSKCVLNRLAFALGLWVAFALAKPVTARGTRRQSALFPTDDDVTTDTSEEGVPRDEQGRKLWYPGRHKPSWLQSLYSAITFNKYADLKIENCGVSEQFPNHRRPRRIRRKRPKEEVQSVKVTPLRSKMMDMFRDDGGISDDDDGGDDDGEIPFLGRIIQGEKSEKGSWPWQVKIPTKKENVT